MVSSPHLVPCIGSSSYGHDRSAVVAGVSTSEEQGYGVPGTYVRGIACGGRHSAVVTGKSQSFLCLFLPFSNHKTWTLF